MHLVPGSGGDILVLSMRRVADLVAYCLQYEFEDVIVDATGADRLEPTRLELVEFKRKVYKALCSVSPAPFARRVTPKLGGLRLHKSYDLFLPIFNHAYEIFALNVVPDWKKALSLRRLRHQRGLGVGAARVPAPVAGRLRSHLSVFESRRVRGADHRTSL